MARKVNYSVISKRTYIADKDYLEEADTLQTFFNRYKSDRADVVTLFRITNNTSTHGWSAISAIYAPLLSYLNAGRRKNAVITASSSFIYTKDSVIECFDIDGSVFL